MDEEGDVAWESRAAYGRDRSPSPKLTSWGLCRYDCEQLLFQNNSAVNMLVSKSSGHACHTPAYGFSSSGIGSRSSMFRIFFGACFRKRRFISGVNSRRRSLIASELKAPAKRFSVSLKVRSCLG